MSTFTSGWWLQWKPWHSLKTCVFSLVVWDENTQLLGFSWPKRALALALQFSYGLANLSPRAWCLTDQRDQPVLHPDVCGRGRGAAPYCPPAVLLQALQRHWSVPSSRQHHFRFKSQCSSMFAGDFHEILLGNKGKGDVWCPGAEASDTACCEPSSSHLLWAWGLFFSFCFTVPPFAHL